MDILFTHSYFYKFDSKQWGFKQPYPPLGTILAASVMREEGFKVGLVDTALADGPEIIAPVLKKTPPKYLVIYDDGFNYLTKMCLTTMREAAFDMIQMAKGQGCQVILCSSDSTDHYQKYLDAGADFILLGEGEVTLKELVRRLENNESHSSIDAIAFKAEEEIIHKPKRAVMHDLDKFPLPAWDLIDIKEYKDIWTRHHGYFSLNIATTRGCPYKCNWCAKPIYGNRYNSRSPEKVVDEIAYLLKEFQPDNFWMCDDIFGLKPGWVQQFRDLVNEKELKFTYKIQSRADLLLKEDNIDALVESGLETVWIGAESGSQKILDAMDKGTTTEQIAQATQLLKKKKVRIAFFLQFGYLGETKEDIQATIKMMKDLLPDEVGISVSYPLPGTKFYDKVKEDLKLKANWQDSDDLDMMFRGTYPPSYYKRLHRYVHNVFRIHKAKACVKDILRNPFNGQSRRMRTILSVGYHLPASIINSYKLKKLEVTN